MKTKQEVIADAYIKLIGEEKFKEWHDSINQEDGTIRVTEAMKLPNDGLGFRLICSYVNHALFIPSSLEGLENNNNWVVIQSEADLPINSGSYHIEFKGGSIETDRFCVIKNNFHSNHWRHITAYRPIENPPKRIY